MAHRGNNRAAQQHSPQLHKQPAPQQLPVSSPKHGRVKTTSIRVLSYWLLGMMALVFVCGFIILTLWNPPLFDNEHPQDTTKNFSLKRRHLTTPFDGQKAGTTKQQVLSFLGHEKEDKINPKEHFQKKNPPTTAISSSPLEDKEKFMDMLRAMQVDPDSIDNATWPLVHIVNTRFMQEQGHLKALGRARLNLFRTFCLPTMVHQSTQRFLWIIKTDPNLDAGILQDLIQDLQPYPNIYLVASNVNFMIRDNHNHTQAHSWRDGAEIQDLLLSRIYTGNPTRLYQAMLQKDRQVVLETRLDADDGLHKFYLQQIQEKALDQFGVLPAEGEEEKEYIPPRWLYWCTRRHVEWHGGMQLTKTFTTLNNTLVSSAESPDYYGSLLVVEHSKLCITPGITVGFGIGTPSEDVPIHAHDKLFNAIQSLKPEGACGYAQVSDCLELVEDFLLVAVRARTPTSAGMQRVYGTDDEENDLPSSSNNSTGKKRHQPQPSAIKMYLYWDFLHDDFFLNREQIQYTNRYILNHLVPIAKDNLEGQCTSDHSCKNGTKEKLLKIIEENK